FDVADAHMPASDAQLSRDAQTLAAQHDLGLSAWLGENLDVRPCNPAAPTRPEHFQHRFLRREPASQMLEVSFDIPRALRLLGRRIDAVEEALAVLIDAAADARGLDDVDSVTQDRHVARISPG